MFLKKINIHNFRGVSEKKTFFCNGFNVIVGKNDTGKSTILKALDYFLNNTTASIELINNASGGSEFAVELLFDPLNIEITIDENITTTFEAEELVNEEGLLQIKRKWIISSQGSKPKLEWYIKRKKYNEDDFILKSESQLITLCNKYNIETHKANSEEYNNVEKRVKLRELFNETDKEHIYEEESLSTTGPSRSKNIYDAIKKTLPSFEYFKADTSLSDSDASIQKYFRDKALEALNDNGKEGLEKAISTYLITTLESIAQKINRVVPSEESVGPEIKFDWSKILTTLFKTKNDDGEILLSQRGDGFRRIVMMAYFESLAEEKNDGKRKMIFGFEEPETFLHPSSQESLFNKLQDMSENNYQIFITTHSPIIVANTSNLDMSLITKDGSFCVEHPVENIESIIKDLGITAENQFFVGQAKALLLLEGPDDIIALKHIAEKYKEAGEIEKNFDDYEVALIPLGGKDSIKHWKNLEVLKKLNRQYLIYHDSDKGNETQESPVKSRLEGWGFVEGDDFYVTKKREMENYILPEALTRITNVEGIQYNDWDDVKKFCKEHVYSITLGGKTVLEKHFTSLEYKELKKSFCPEGDDEFLMVYNKLVSKINREE